MWQCPSAGNTTQIAQLLQGTAALASVAQYGTHYAGVRRDIKNATHDRAVVYSITDAVHSASLPASVVAAAFAQAIDNGLTQGGELPANYDPEVTAVLIAAAKALGQDDAITQGLTEVSSVIHKCFATSLAFNCPVHVDVMRHFT